MDTQNYKKIIRLIKINLIIYGTSTLICKVGGYYKERKKESKYKRMMWWKLDLGLRWKS